MGGEFRLHHGSATTEKAAQAAGRVEAIVGDVVNGNRRAWGRIDVEDIALLIQHARDAAASPDWLSKMAIETLVTRGDAIKAQRDAATARAELAEARLAKIVDYIKTFSVEAHERYMACDVKQPAHLTKYGAATALDCAASDIGRIATDPKPNRMVIDRAPDVR